MCLYNEQIFEVIYNATPYNWCCMNASSLQQRAQFFTNQANISLTLLRKLELTSLFFFTAEQLESDVTPKAKALKVGFQALL